MPRVRSPRVVLATSILLLAAAVGCAGEKDEDEGILEAAKEPEYHPGMLDVTKASKQAPDVFRVRFETTKGDFVVEAHRDWAPIGADRFYNLARIHYFDGVPFFRVVKGFMAQFGLHPDPDVNAVWADATIKDDPVKKTNARGYITFAKTNAPNSRSVQFFINFENNTRLDRDGFAPFGRVVEGMDVVDKLYSGYGEKPSRKQGQIIAQGAKALEEYPMLDRIEKARLVEP